LKAYSIREPKQNINMMMVHIPAKESSHMVRPLRGGLVLTVSRVCSIAYCVNMEKTAYKEDI
jgi:hypothetical protein